ncbi:hypothetical protein BB560_004332, partial [Smittium megazygosporum]
YVPKTFKNHLKKTDVCSVCIAGNKAKLDLEQAKNPNNLDVFTIVRLQKLVGDFEAHRELEKMQKNAFKDHKQQLDKESCNLIADFKENFRIGGGPVESGNNFYQKNGELQKIHLWSDSGAHFKNSDYIYAIFKELQSIYMGKMFSLNFFLENHGKSDVDGHFGVLSRWFRDAEKQQDILSIEDLVTCFEQKSSHNRSTRGLDASDEAYKFYIYSRDMPRVDRHQIKIDGGIKLNLSYYFVNEKLFAIPICSEDLSLYNPVAYKIVKAKDTRKDKYAPDQIQRMNAGDVLMGPSSIRIQMKRMEMLRDISGVFGNSFETSNNFRLSSKGYFLTYPQFEFSKQQVLDEFKTIGINPIKYIIAQENHNLSDGNHIHQLPNKHESEEINSAINLGQSRISDGLRVMAASSLQEMKDIAAAMAEQNQNEIAAKELEEQRKKYRFKEFPLVDLWVRNLYSLWLRERTNIGKTFYALSLFHNPLLVSDLEGLKLLDYTKHDEIIFDDIYFFKA